VAADASISSERHRPGWRNSLAASALVVLSRPWLAAIALAGFLARGGIVALLVPIVVLPTPAGLANVFAPFVVQLYFGHVSAGVIALVALVATGVVAWLLIGGAVGALSEVALIRAGAADDELTLGSEARVDQQAPGTRIVVKVLLARLIAHLPLLIVLAWSAGRIYQATYSELTSPFEVVTPLIVRILTDVPDAIVAVVVTWLLGEVAGGLAARYLVLGERSSIDAVIRGWWHLLRHPRSSIGTLFATDLVALLAVATAYAIASIGWDLVEATVLDSGNPLLAIGAVVALVAAWLASLIVVGLVVCWRSVFWTAEWLRLRPLRVAGAGTPTVRSVGTIGGDDDVRTGDWSSANPSGTV
jgi:hypothetical protein